MKKVLMTVFSMLMLIGGSLLLTACNKEELKCDFTIEQENESQNLIVSWDCEEFLSEIEILVEHDSGVVSKVTLSGEDSLAKKETDVYAYYGKHDVTIKAKSTSGKSIKVEKEVSLSASEYNIAPLSGSMPVLLFTLRNWEITDAGNTNIPTFVWLARSGSWDWTKLPENIYAMPNADMDDILVHDNYNEMVKKTNEYIQELYSVNSESKFNLYINDYNAYLYLELLAANGISEENYTCTFLSDGAFSYSIINNTFNVEDATTKYNEMVEKYNTTKQQVEEIKDYDLFNGFEVVGNDLQKYLLVMANEDPSVRWWFPRLRTQHIDLNKDTSNFLTTKIFQGTSSTPVSENIKEYGISGLLTNIQKDEEKVAQLKSLYKFNDDMFEEAEKQGKKVMMLLGSWATNETEENFVDYANFVKNYYGDEYVYYYKGHPNSPTDMYPVRAKLLEDMGLIDIESTIAAELILFFFPDIYMSGYSSTTFNSVQAEEMACAFWGQTKAQAEAIENQNGDMFDVFITVPSAHGTTYDEYLVEGHTCYVVEFQDTTEYQFAIYDATENEIIYYPVGE